MTWLKSFTWSGSRLARFVLIILVLAMGTSCENLSAGLELAGVGAKTADTLGRYYTSLIQDTVDIMEMNAYIDTVVLQRPPDVVQQRELSDQIEALDYRKSLARHLFATYTALKELAAGDTSAEVGKATENLVASLTTTPKLTRSSADPAGAIGALFADLAAWRRSQDVSTGAQLLLKGLDGFGKLFDRETEVYKSIARQRVDLMGVVVDVVIKKGQVSIKWPLLQHIAGVTGLASPLLEQGIGDPETARALARVRLGRHTMLTRGATDSMGQALVALIQSHRSYLEGKDSNLGDVTASLQTVQFYLDEVDKLRSIAR